MRIVWAHNWFLDYRVPVFEELNRLAEGELFVLYNTDNIPERVSKKVQSTLGNNAVPFSGEREVTVGNRRASGDFANKYISLKYQPGLYAKILELKPDVIVGEGFFRWGLTNITARVLHGVPYVMLYERTQHTERNVRKPVYLARKALMRWIDVICCNGVETDRYVRSMGFDETRITHGHMVADIHRLARDVDAVSEEDRQRLKREMGISGRVYLYVGQLIPRKGLRELLAAWSAFTRSNQGQDLTLLIAGDGDSRREYEEQASGMRGVLFLGKIDHDQLHRYMKVADISVMPTLEDNWSLVVPEAMAAGLPVLTTIYNGCHPELITPKNGWVCDPLLAGDLTASLQTTLLEAGALKKMGQHSRSIVAHHSPQSAAQAIFHSCKLAMSVRGRRT